MFHHAVVRILAVISLVSVTVGVVSGQAVPEGTEQAFTEAFDDAALIGEWDWSHVNTSLELDGGASGGFLRGERVLIFVGDLYYPTLESAVPSAFAGDWRGRRVSRVDFDLLHESSSPPLSPELKVSLELHDTSGPISTNGAFTVLDAPIPAPGAGWTRYSVPIPSGAEGMPVGWQPSDVAGPVDWDALMGNVRRIVIRFGSPLEFGEGNWVVGVDNLAIVGDALFSSDLGQALTGTAGPPSLAFSGASVPGETFALELTGALPGAAGWLALGLEAVNLPLRGGVMVPAFAPPLGLLQPLGVDARGRFTLGSTWPAGIAPLSTLFVQVWLIDPGGPFGAAASNALQLTAG